MYCGNCGAKAERGEGFCKECGFKLALSSSSKEKTTVSVTDWNKNQMIFIGINLVLVFVYFVKWLKLEGEAGLLFDLGMGYMNSGLKNSLSPSQLVKILGQLQDYFGYFDFSNAKAYLIYIIYLMPIIPLAAIGSIVCMLLKKMKYSLILFSISGMSAIFFVVIALYISTEEYIGFTFGVPLALITGIMSLVYAQKLKKDLL